MEATTQYDLRSDGILTAYHCWEPGASSQEVARAARNRTCCCRLQAYAFLMEFQPLQVESSVCADIDQHRTGEVGPLAASVIFPC